MKRDLIAVAAFLSPALLSSQEKPAETPTFPAQVELVTVDTVVTDKKGQPVTGLTAGDFTLLEDGAPQSITTFEAIALPPLPSSTTAPRPRVSSNTTPDARTGRTFVIVFDDVHLAPFQSHRAKLAIAEFLRNGVREGDRVTLVATGGGAWWSTRMEAGRDELIAVLKRLDGRYIPDTSPERVTEWEAMRIHVYRDPQVGQRVLRRLQNYGLVPTERGGGGRELGDDPQVLSRAADVYFQTVSRNRISLETMERVIDSLAATKGRKTLILVSQGFIYDPNMDEFKRVVQSSRRANAAIYFVDTRGLGGLPATISPEFGPAIDNQDIGASFTEHLEASEGAESIAADSGGFSVKNANNLGKGIQRIADESRTYYLLGYHPTNSRPDGKFRKIQVKVKRKGMQVRARKGYFAPLEGGSALDRKPGTVDPKIQEALDSPYDLEEIPLRMTAYVFEETLLGKANVLVATDVDIRSFALEEREGRFHGTLEFLLVVAHRDSGEYFRYDQKIEMKLLPETREKAAKSGFPIVRTFDLAPGGYQAKIVVRDKQSGLVGTVIHEFDVPELSQLRVSSPVLSDTIHPREDEIGPPVPVLLARRSFPAGSTLYVSYDVYGAKKDKATGMPKVTAGYMVQRKDGTKFTEMAPTQIRPTSLGKLSRLMGTPLEGAQPGDYEVVLSLKDEISGQALEVHEPFTVEAPQG